MTVDEKATLFRLLAKFDGSDLVDSEIRKQINNIQVEVALSIADTLAHEQSQEERTPVDKQTNVAEFNYGFVEID